MALHRDQIARHVATAASAVNLTAVNALDFAKGFTENNCMFS